MTQMYGIYYYMLTHNSANVILLALCTTVEKSIEIIRQKFINFTVANNNAVRCTDKLCINKYIIWINQYDTDKELEYIGMTCNQPCNSISILDKI
jgi:hypothetical protein